MDEKYIPLSAALSVAAAWCPDDDGSVGKTGDLREMLDELEAIEPADVRPVVHGEWNKSYADHEAFGVRPFFRYCSECHESTVYPYNFCPHCGADMRPEPPEREVEA